MQNLDIALQNLNIRPGLPRKVDATAFWMGDHRWESNCFFYVLDGAFVLNVDDHNYIVKKHQMALLPGGHPHTYWRLPNQPLSFYQFCFKAECHGQNFFDFFGFSDDHHVVNVPPEPVMHCYNQMLNGEFASNNLPRRLTLCVQHSQLCLLYAHARISADKAKHEFTDVITYMRDHITEDVSLDTLAGLFHFDPTYFVKKFKKQMGIAPMKYFAQIRAKHAANLLKTTDMTANEVAAATGFSDVYYFKTFFARNMGVRPEQYRNALTRPDELRFSE